jgi:uncharacterized Zn-binding protein involved in type VI secretion
MSSVAVNPPKTPVTEGSGDKSLASLPNVCKMPGPPAPFVPTPLPNLGNSSDSLSDATTTVKIEGKKVAIKGTYYMSKLSGDMASKGTGGGIVSATTEGKTKFVAPGSMNVKAEGENIQLLGDAMTGNGNTDNTANPAGNIQAPKAKDDFRKRIGNDKIADALCQAACEALKKHQEQVDKGKGANSRKTSHMRNALDPNPRGTGKGLSSGLPNGVLTEVGQIIAPGGGGAFVGKWGTMARKAASGVKAVKWDIVLTKAGEVVKKGGLTMEKVEKLIEVKFPPDKPTKNQKSMLNDLSEENAKKIETMDVAADCICE